ncbi:MAG: hypothetical protein WC298_08435 [Sideroxydans sp.]|jgi:hypothetical protein
MSQTTDKKYGEQSPKCNDCIHYYITYDANFRFGCRALDFKSQRLPMLDVFETSGQPCHFFRSKPRRL